METPSIDTNKRDNIFHIRAKMQSRTHHCVETFNYRLTLQATTFSVRFSQTHCNSYLFSSHKIKLRLTATTDIPLSPACQ
jgi:hypothetical protein